MLNTTDFMIEEGQKLAEIAHIPYNFDYMGDNEICPKCGQETVYGESSLSDANTISGEYKCTSCGYEWGVI